MPLTYNSNEYVDMLIVYGECRRNSREAANLYRERFPERHHPSHTTFNRVEAKLRTGSFPSTVKHANHNAPARNEENVINILAYVAVNPHVSLRRLAEEIGVSKATVHRILKGHRYHPFKVHLSQELRLNDLQRRLDFIARLQVLEDENPNYLNCILWSDESRFHNNGVVNKHNAHYWSNQNPRWMEEARFQTVWGTNVWCGMFNGHLIGPHFYEGTLTGQRYLHFLQNVLPDLMEDIPLNERRDIIWQQDGAPPHNAQIVTNYLNALYPNGWIGNRGSIPWPARSPDLSPVDFFMWGYLKEFVYQVRSADLDDLKNRIRMGCRIMTHGMILSSCNRGLRRRLEACVHADGAQFEHLLN